MFILPLRKNFKDEVKKFLDLNPDYNNIDTIILSIDIQNLSLSKFDPKFAETFVSNDDFNIVEHFENLLYWIAYKRNELVNELNKDVFIIIYDDTGRNIFNQNFIPTWKEDRKKAYIQMKDKNPADYQFVTFCQQAITKITENMAKLLKHSPVSSFFSLENIDSDFVAYLMKLLFELKGHKPLNIILSSDHDYNHMLSEDIRNIRYIFLNNMRKKRDNHTFEHKYNLWYGLKHKFGLTEDEARFVAKNYSVFHALIGDPGDGFKTLIPRKGIKYWIKNLVDFDINYVRECVLNDNCFIPELKDIKSDVRTFGNKWQEFRSRYFIVDFYFTSHFFLKDYNPESREIYEKFISDFPYQKEVLENSIKSFVKQLEEKQIVDTSEIANGLKQIGFRNPEYIAESLF